MESEAHAIARGPKGGQNVIFAPATCAYFGWHHRDTDGCCGTIFPQRFPAARPGRKGLRHCHAYLGRQCGVPGAHETPNGQCTRRHIRVLPGGDGMGHSEARRRGNRHFRLGIPLLVGIALLILGIAVVYGHAKSPKGVPIGMYFVMGSVMLLAAAGDIRMLVHGGVFGAKRIVRHLWRMCFGLFIATGSFFLGQQQVFPAWLRGSSVLFVPALLPLVLLIFWLFRVRFTNAYKRMSMPRGCDVNSLRT